MFLAQIRLAATEKLECQAGILRLIGGDSLKPTREWMKEEQGVQECSSQVNPAEIEGGHETDSAAPDSKAEDPLERYRKMLKVGVPRSTVEKRMHNDGFNPAELNGHILVDATGFELAPKPVDIAVATTRRRKWHWSEVPDYSRAPPPPNGSIWTEVSKEGAHQRVSAPSQTHIRELYVRDIDNQMESTGRESLASMTNDPEMASSIQHRSHSEKKDKVRVMKGAKGTNLEFAVSHLSHPFAKVAKDVNILTAMYLQDTDIKTMLAMWPSMAEQFALDEYSGDFESLGRCEQFLVTIRAVPMAKEKLQCLLLKLEIASRAEHLKQTVELVTRALNQVCASSMFTEVIRLLRDFGNLANEEFAANYKARFSLESLLKMDHTKAFDKKTTIFDGFLQVLRTEADGRLANFYDEINLVIQCKGVSVGGLISEMNQLREGHLLVKSVALASDNAADEGAKLAHAAFNQFADEIDDKLRGVQMSFNEMEASHRKFVSWFEEDPNLPLDQHLKAIANFALKVKDRYAVLNWACKQSSPVIS